MAAGLARQEAATHKEAVSRYERRLLERRHGAANGRMKGVRPESGSES